MRKNSLIAFFLALLMLVPMIVSCSEDVPPVADTENSEQDPSSEQNPSSESVESAPETEERIEPNLPQVTYEGADFRFYSWDIEGRRVWEDIWVEGMTSEPINDAVYNRNQTIEDRYDVHIVHTKDYYTTYEDNVRINVNAGDDAWEVLISMGHSIPRMYTHSLFYNLHDLEYVDFDQPWWDQNCVESFTLMGYMPFTVSDMLVLDKAYTSATFFNKNIAEQYQIDNLYQIVKDGKWTIDKMIEFGTMVADDVDGDGLYTDDDRYGLVCLDTPVYMLFHSAGGRYVTKDESDQPVLSFKSDYNFTVIQYYLEELMYREDLTRNNTFKDNAKSPLDMFMADQALFYMSELSATDILRSMESDFGIIPVPNYDETQDHYSSSVSVFYGNLISVPITCRALEMTGILLEAMSAESMYEVIPAFYDTVLKGKSARDPESVEMLDIIINNMVFDVGDFYNLNDFPDYFLRITGSAAHLNRTTRTSDIASFWAKREKATERALNNLIRYINRWNAANNPTE